MTNRLFLLLLCVAAFAQHVMKNDDVIYLLNHGASVKEVVEKINGATAGFSLDESDLRTLRKNGVPAIVIQAMSARQTGAKFKLDESSTSTAPQTGPAYTVEGAETAEPHVLSPVPPVTPPGTTSQRVPNSIAPAPAGPQERPQPGTQAGDIGRADDTLTVTSIPSGATVEWNRKIIGTTPLTYKVGEYAFNARKTTVFSKRLQQPVVLRLSKEGYITKQLTITTAWTWRSLNGKLAGTFYTIPSNAYQIDLDKIAAVRAPLTNADVLKLKEAGFGDDLIIDKIANNPAAFRLELDDMVELHRAGISDAVIQAMLHAK